VSIGNSTTEPTDQPEPAPAEVKGHGCAYNGKLEAYSSTSAVTVQQHH
jgi:hypothetical protein